MRFGREQRAETCGAILRDQASIYQKGNKLVPGEIVSGRGEIGKVQSKAPGDEMRGIGRVIAHITGDCLYAGYTRFALPRNR